MQDQDGNAMAYTLEGVAQSAAPFCGVAGVDPALMVPMKMHEAAGERGESWRGGLRGRAGRARTLPRRGAS